MADLIIKGMEMPKCCALCDLEHWDEDSYGDEMNHRCCLYRKGYTAKVRETGRLPDCPLVPLPEGHGRLGDLETAEAILHNKTFDLAGKSAEYNALNWALRQIKALPTIVPAEGGGEECSEN